MRNNTLPRHQFTNAYVNVAETLVTQEVMRQLEQLPQHVQAYIQPNEVTICALDHLPALYFPALDAFREKEWQYQYQLAKHKLQVQVAKAVRQALVEARYQVFSKLSKQEKLNYLEGWQSSSSEMLWALSPAEEQDTGLGYSTCLSVTI